jgi:hypothetical protein
MKIVVLKPNQLRAWFRNLPVLVDSETGEAVLTESGNPRHPDRKEIVAILKSAKAKKQYTVKVEDRDCHYVVGRDFLRRTFVRMYNCPVQLRSSTGQVLGMARPKFIGHDIAKSDVKPMDGRPYKQARTDVAPTTVQLPPVQNVPRPEDCPECSRFSKPLGCRQDEHHFVCSYHDAWESFRAAKMAIEVQEGEAPESLIPRGLVSVIDLRTGEAVREATSEEIEKAKALIESGELPIITIGDSEYAVGDESFTLPGGQ